MSLHDLLRACRANDTTEMARLLDEAEFSPADLDAAALECLAVSSNTAFRYLVDHCGVGVSDHASLMLREAIAKGQLQTVQHLIHKGADISLMIESEGVGREPLLQLLKRSAKGPEVQDYLNFVERYFEARLPRAAVNLAYDSALVRQNILTGTAKTAEDIAALFHIEDMRSNAAKRRQRLKPGK